MAEDILALYKINNQETKGWHDGDFFDPKLLYETLMKGNMKESVLALENTPFDKTFRCDSCTSLSHGGKGVIFPLVIDDKPRHSFLCKGCINKAYILLKHI